MCKTRKAVCIHDFLWSSLLNESLDEQWPYEPVALQSLLIPLKSLLTPFPLSPEPMPRAPTCCPQDQPGTVWAERRIFPPMYKILPQLPSLQNKCFVSTLFLNHNSDCHNNEFPMKNIELYTSKSKLINIQEKLQLRWLDRSSKNGWKMHFGL
jgi:hypothetical protein